ncbi:MAG: VOC family protein, partial [Euryarchaeota archaeon]|nr:VOC family protein [Euryarchaeota archaeon]
MSKVIHFEIGAERALRFHESAFGWTSRKGVGQPHYLVMGEDKDEPGIGGAMRHREEQAQPVVDTITVRSLDDTIMKIHDGGGMAITPEMDVKGVGTMAYS